MTHPVYPEPTAAAARKRRELTPEASAAFRAFSQAVFAEGALPVKVKQLIAVAVASWARPGSLASCSQAFCRSTL